MLEFDWDKDNLQHIAEHEVLRAEAEQVINNEPLDLDCEITNGEERFSHLGETKAGRILYVVTTWRQAKLRVVTAFPPTKSFRKFYLQWKGKLYENKIGDP